MFGGFDLKDSILNTFSWSWLITWLHEIIKDPSKLPSESFVHQSEVIIVLGKPLLILIEKIDCDYFAFNLRNLTIYFKTLIWKESYKNKKIEKHFMHTITLFWHFGQLNAFINYFVLDFWVLLISSGSVSNAMKINEINKLGLIKKK